MMPAVSKKQKTFMDAVAHNPAFAKKVGVPKSVGKDFSKASKGMKFGSGPKTRADSQAVNKPKTNQGKQELFNKGNTTMANKMNPGMKAIMAKKMGKPTMKKGIKKMADGGMPMVMKDGKKIPAFAADGKGKMAHGGMAHKMMHGGMTHKMAHGGGIETQGKTRGKMVNMKHGGKA
jgi:hypothetical protein